MPISSRAGWKLPDGSLSHPLGWLELSAFVCPLRLLQIMTGGLLCARPCERFENVASFDLGLCSWTGACNLGVTERPARVGAGASVGTPPAHSGAGGMVSRLGQPDPGGQGQALHAADPPGTCRAMGQRGGAESRTRKRRGTGWGGQSGDPR